MEKRHFSDVLMELTEWEPKRISYGPFRIFLTKMDEVFYTIRIGKDKKGTDIRNNMYTTIRVRADGSEYIQVFILPATASTSANMISQAFSHVFYNYADRKGAGGEMLYKNWDGIDKAMFAVIEFLKEMM